MDANFSDLHALQSQKIREQGMASIGGMSPNGSKAVKSVCPRPSNSPKIQSSGLCFCTDLVRRQGPWTSRSSLTSIDHAADYESVARDRRQVLLNRTVSCIVGDTRPLEETVETDSECGD
ncbi:hypothetical protein Taro_000360 [Colocasia esculenta]|uniref:Uncharacterized protein n=1 Tax=Colocasia esculenta TaxID=4460 RepID=A0A843THD9_COLES|nr:hypothetical protein [Colocasia esculenta]